MKITCGSCGKAYDYDREELCPRCGAHNQPPRAADGTPARHAGAADPQLRRGWQTYRQPERAPGTPPPGWTTYTAPSSPEERRSGRWKIAAGIGALLLFMVIGGVAGGLSASRSIREREEHGGMAASTAASLAARAEREAAAPFEAPDGWDGWETPDPSSADGMPGDEASVPGVWEEPGPEPSAAPAADLSALASFAYGTELGASKGVTLTVNFAGPAGSAGLENLLMPGEKAVFIDFTAEVTDADAFGREFFQPPFVRVGQDGGRSLWPYGTDLPAPFALLDVDGMRDTDRTVTSGQLFFAVPEDCHTVMLHYGDPDESYYIQRINI